MCIFTDELHSCSYAQTVNSDRKGKAGKAVLYAFIHKSAAGRFFECAANSAGGERLRREGETSRSRGETGDIILLNESFRFIQNVASCYALCLTKESVHLHLDIWQTLLSKATYNWGIHKAIHLEEAIRQRKCS